MVQMEVMVGMLLSIQVLEMAVVEDLVVTVCSLIFSLFLQ